MNLSEHAYLKAISIMLFDQTLTYYYSNKVIYFTFDDFCINMKAYFENFKWQRSNLDKWQIFILKDVIAANSNVSLIECLRKLCAKMNIIQRKLDSAYHDSIWLRKNIIRTCRDHSVLIFELINSLMNISTLINTLQFSIINYEIVRKSFAQQQHQYHQNQYHQTKDEIDDQYFIDKQYRLKKSFNRRENFRDREDRFQARRSKKCFVCEKSDCWSINHSEKKRKNSKKRFSDRYLEYKIRQEFDRRLNQYIADYESDSEDEYVTQYFDELAISSAFESDIKLIEFESDELFLTSFDEFSNIESFISALADKVFQYRLISKNIINAFINKSFDLSYISISDSRYDDIEFKNILVNCDAADRSIKNMSQFKALQRISDVVLNKKTIESSIKFEIDNTLILEFVELNISLEIITFRIMKINTSFLLCLNDFDRLDIYFNNLINQIVQYEHTSMKRRHFVIRRYEHAFFLWKMFIQSLIFEFIEKNSCLLIEIELRRLHRRFDHFSTRRLYEILERFDHEIEHRVIEHLIEFCHHCQLHDKSLDRFIFSIRDEDIQFNYNIVVDILYMKWKSADNNKSILHIMNETIRFQTSRWLKNISTRHVWNQLRACWIDTYLKSFDVIIADADKQFVVREFKQYENNMRITIKTISVETHHLIEMMKRYHDSLRRMYAIITIEISNIDLEIALQMTFKVINDSIELDELIFTLLMFDVYLRMIEMNVSSSIITQRAIAMRKAMKEVQKFIAIRQMNDALNTRNDFITILIHELSLNSLVLIFHESKSNQSEAWKRLFKLLNIQNESAIIELSNESIKFRIISLKSYYQNDDHINDELSFSSAESSIEL